MKASESMLKKYNVTDVQVLNLINASIKTLQDNLHLCDGDNCTLKDLKDAVSDIDPLWEIQIE